MSVPKYLVRAGGECPQDWLCADIPEVQAALCEALFGSPKDADSDEIAHYLHDIQTMAEEEIRRHWRFEDGWLEVIKLRLATRATECGLGTCRQAIAGGPLCDGVCKYSSRGR